MSSFFWFANVILYFSAPLSLSGESYGLQPRSLQMHIYKLLQDFKILSKTLRIMVTSKKKDTNRLMFYLLECKLYVHVINKKI